MRWKPSLDGLRDAARIWYDWMGSLLRKAKLDSWKSSPCIFCSPGMIFICYAHDLLIFAEHDEQIERLEEMLNTYFILKDLGKPTQFLNIEIYYWIPQDVGLRETTLIYRLLHTHGVKPAKTVEKSYNSGTWFQWSRDQFHSKGDSRYRSITGSSFYLARKKRPDFCVCVSILGSFVERPRTNDVIPASQIPLYICSTTTTMLVVRPGGSNQLNAYVDASWGEDTTSKRRGRTGIAVRYETAPTYLLRTVQKSATLISSEVENTALSETTKTLI